MQADFLRKRGEEFYKNGIKLLEEGVYSIATFNFEQASQLFLKYYLFLKIKDFPKTHSLKRLLEDIGRAYNKEKKMGELIEKNIDVISDLEEAYITSRYLPAEFYKPQVEEMKKFVEGLKEFLKNL